MNLERQGRRHLLGSPQVSRVYPAPGCGEALDGELRELIASVRTPSRLPVLKALRGAIVLQQAQYRLLLELTLRLTTAQDISLVVGRAAVHNRADLARLLESIRFDLYLREGGTVAAHVESHASSLYHEGLIRGLLAERLARLGARIEEAAERRLRLRIVHNFAAVELSLAGAPLWRRGYRGLLHASAPLREDLAQAAIRLALSDARKSGGAAEPPAAALIPFAGSGTLLFEYLIARHAIPPFIFRSHYAFEGFPCGVPPSVAWVRRGLLDELSARLTGATALFACLVDRSAAAAEAAEANRREFTARIAAGGDTGPLPCPLAFDYRTEDAFARPWRRLVPEGSTSLFLPLNPPYGRRLATRSADELYRRIGGQCVELAGSLPRGGLIGFILCPGEPSWRAFREAAAGLATTTSHFTQGGLDIRLCRFHS